MALAATRATVSRIYFEKVLKVFKTCKTADLGFKAYRLTYAEKNRMRITTMGWRHKTTLESFQITTNSKDLYSEDIDEHFDIIIPRSVLDNYVSAKEYISFERDECDNVYIKGFDADDYKNADCVTIYSTDIHEGLTQEFIDAYTDILKDYKLENIIMTDEVDLLSELKKHLDITNLSKDAIHNDLGHTTLFFGNKIFTAGTKYTYTHSHFAQTDFDKDKFPYDFGVEISNIKVLTGIKQEILGLELYGKDKKKMVKFMLTNGYGLICEAKTEINAFNTAKQVTIKDHIVKDRAAFKETVSINNKEFMKLLKPKEGYTFDFANRKINTYLSSKVTNSISADHFIAYDRDGLRNTDIAEKYVYNSQLTKAMLKDMGKTAQACFEGGNALIFYNDSATKYYLLPSKLKM